jgi:hypothetical protein
VALLALLRRLVQPAQLVLVLAAVGADALALQRAEDVVGAVVLLEVLLLLLELGLLRRDLVRGRLVGLAGGRDQPRLAAALGVVGQDAVLDEPDAGEVELAVDVVADETGKVCLEVVDCTISSSAMQSWEKGKPVSARK